MLGLAELIIILVILGILIGVPLTIVLVVLKKKRKRCHHCQKRIHRDALVCPFCQRDQRPTGAE